MSSAVAARYAEETLQDEAIKQEVANGYRIDERATPATLSAEDRSRFAIAPDETYAPVRLDGTFRGIVPGAACCGEPAPRSPWAVWATSELLSAAECGTWKQREVEKLEDSDFIFAGGGRLPTGVRRQSATHGIEDAAFAALMEARLAGQIPASIEGRAFVGVRNTFLTSRYQPGQYFAPHFDGRGGSTGRGVDGAPCSEFTVVHFTSGETHYITGQGSEVATSSCTCVCSMAWRRTRRAQYNITRPRRRRRREAAARLRRCPPLGNGFARGRRSACRDQAHHAVRPPL